MANTLAYYDTATNTARKVKGSNKATADTGSRKKIKSSCKFFFLRFRKALRGKPGGGGSGGRGGGWLSLKVITTWMRFPRAASLA